MHDAHVHEMQMQMWKPNTWGVTEAAEVVDQDMVYEDGHFIPLDGGLLHLH